MHAIEHAVPATSLHHLVLRIVHEAHRDVLIEEQEYGGHDRREEGAPSRPHRQVEYRYEPRPAARRRERGGYDERGQCGGGALGQFGPVGHEGAGDDAQSRTEIRQVLPHPLVEIHGIAQPPQDGGGGVGGRCDDEREQSLREGGCGTREAPGYVLNGLDDEDEGD